MVGPLRAWIPALWVLAWAFPLRVCNPVTVSSHKSALGASLCYHRDAPGAMAMCHRVVTNTYACVFLPIFPPPRVGDRVPCHAGVSSLGAYQHIFVLRPHG